MKGFNYTMVPLHDPRVILEFKSATPHRYDPDYSRIPVVRRGPSSGWTGNGQKTNPLTGQKANPCRAGKNPPQGRKETLQGRKETPVGQEKNPAGQERIPCRAENKPRRAGTETSAGHKPPGRKLPGLHRAEKKKKTAGQN